MIFFLGLLIALIVVLLPIPFTSCVLIALLGMFIGLFIYVGKKTKEAVFLPEVFLLSFILKITVSLLVYNFIFSYRGTGLMGDGWSYSENGYSIVQIWLSGIKNIGVIEACIRRISPSGTVGSYDFWNAAVYFFTSKSPVSLIFINCLVSSLTVIFIYYITKQLYNEKAAKIAAVLTAFWPSLFIWSIQNLKEPLSIFLLVVLIWAILQLKLKFKFYLLFLIILVSIALRELRLVSFFVFFGAIFPIYLILLLWRKNRILSIFLFLLTGAVMAVIIDNYLKDRTILEYINYARTVRASRGNTSFLPNLDITNPVNFIFFVPVALAVAWLSPFPWQMGSTSQITVIPEMLLYYALLPVMFLGWSFVMKYKIREGGLIIVYIAIMMLVLAFVEGNIGTLFRHRAMVLPFMFILIGVGIDRIKNKEKTA